METSTKDHWGQLSRIQGAYDDEEVEDPATEPMKTLTDADFICLSLRTVYKNVIRPATFKVCLVKLEIIH